MTGTSRPDRPEGSTPVWMGADLVACGMIRIQAEGVLFGITRAEATGRTTQALKLLESWLGTPDTDLRNGAIPITTSLAKIAAATLHTCHAGRMDDAGRWLAEQCTTIHAFEQLEETAHGPGPIACDLTGLYLQEVLQGHDHAAQDARLREAAQIIDDYVRPASASEDAYALVLATSLLATKLLVRVMRNDVTRVFGFLDAYATSLMTAGGPPDRTLPDVIAELLGSA